jgi:hypothetical protein
MQFLGTAGLDREKTGKLSAGRRQQWNYHDVRLDGSSRRLLELKQRSQRIVINMTPRCQPTSKLSGADVRRLVNLTLLEARLDVC